MYMRTLAIETSCDDTSIAIVTNDRWIFEVEKMEVNGRVIPVEILDSGDISKMIGDEKKWALEIQSKKKQAL